MLKMIQATHAPWRGGALGGTSRTQATVLALQHSHRLGTLGLSASQKEVLSNARKPVLASLATSRQLTTPRAAAPEAAPALTTSSTSDVFDINVSQLHSLSN